MFFWRSLIRMARVSFLIVLCLVSGASADESSQEYQVKAAFLVNFARFISWPEGAFSPARPDFSLCIIGKNQFGSALTGLDEKRIDGRRISIEHISTFQLASSCHMLYVESSEEKNYRANAASLAHKPLVTVSDISGFADIGGGIEFVSQGSKLSFIINRSSMIQNGIQVRAALLDLALSVK